jgi:hypothetical protein
MVDGTVQLVLAVFRRASLTKLLLFAGGLSLLAIHALPQKASGDNLPGPLPPTTIVVSSIVVSSPSEGSPDSSSTATEKLAPKARPSIVWHWVDGHKRWHCVAHCSVFRKHHGSPGEELDDSDTN